jgi:hypothetical protein
MPPLPMAAICSLNSIYFRSLETTNRRAKRGAWIFYFSDLVNSDDVLLSFAIAMTNLRTAIKQKGEITRDCYSFAVFGHFLKPLD